MRKTQLVNEKLVLTQQQRSKAEMQLLALFQQKESELKRREEERRALSKIISKGSNYTVGILSCGIDTMFFHASTR